MVENKSSFKVNGSQFLNMFLSENKYVILDTNPHFWVNSETGYPLGFIHTVMYVRI